MTQAAAGDAFPTFADFFENIRTSTHEKYQKLPSCRVLGAQAFEEQKQHLLSMYGGIEVAHSFSDSAGQIFDCIPINMQPALRKHGGSISEPPVLPPLKLGLSAKHTPHLLDPTRRDRFGNVMSCPPGTVPIRRITLEELGRFETLGRYFKKSPRSVRGSMSHLIDRAVSPEASTPHEYAHACQNVSTIGGHSILSVWSPAVTGSNAFSLSQQWYVATGNQGVQTAEVGWQVFPLLYGHSQPVLFTYWTADGYASTGSYNTHDFVQNSSSCPVGYALDQVSTPGGQAVEIELLFLLTDGNWWLYVNGSDTTHAVGYYPTSLYQSGPMSTGATEIDYGGETVSDGTYPPMGSGAFASAGNGYAAYHRSIYYFPPQGGTETASLTGVQDWPGSYTINVQESDDWGEYFFFGGPGGNGAPAEVATIAASNNGMSATPLAGGLEATVSAIIRAATTDVNEKSLLFPSGIGAIEIKYSAGQAESGSTLSVKIDGKENTSDS